MPNFQKDPNNPKADFFNTAIGGAPKSPGGNKMPKMSKLAYKLKSKAMEKK
jgi:hypothetical protein